MRSSRDIRLIAPDLVLGGKNSREKNLSFEFIRDSSFSFNVDLNEQQIPAADPKQVMVIGVVHK